MYEGMEPQLIEKNSIKVFGLMLAVSLIPSFYFQMISISLGLALGYLVNLLVFRVVQQEASVILLTGSKYTASLIILLGLAKLGLRALGFMLAIKFPTIFNLYGVFVGYFVIKLTIFYLGYRMRKE